MTEREAYVAFNLTDNVGPATVEKLISRYGSAADAWAEYPGKISRTGGEIEWEKEFALAGKFGVEIVTMADEKYPKPLRGSPGAPLVLYVKGSVDALSLPSVAMIGTRRATDYGLGTANRFSYDLCKASWCVVSGLALGIDAESHRGALEAGGGGIDGRVHAEVLQEMHGFDDVIVMGKVRADGGEVVLVAEGDFDLTGVLFLHAQNLGAVSGFAVHGGGIKFQRAVVGKSERNKTALDGRLNHLFNAVAAVGKIAVGMNIGSGKHIKSSCEVNRSV
jgi:hypothetical protein